MQTLKSRFLALYLSSLTLVFVAPPSTAQTGAAVVPAAATQAPSATALPKMDSILATGDNGTSVSLADVMADLQRAPEQARKSVLSKLDSLQQVVGNLIMRRMLAKQQLPALANDPLLAINVEMARERVLSDARLAAIDAQNTPTDSALEAHARNVYQANPARFEQPAQARARHILLSKTEPEAMNKAKDVLAQLRSGASFEELAKTLSQDKGSAARGGDLGFFGPGKMVPAFEAAVTKLQSPGDLSDVVESEFGYHIIRLEERRTKSTKPFEEVREQLLAEARRAAINDGRNQLSQNLSKAIAMDNLALEALAKSNATP